MSEVPKKSSEFTNMSTVEFASLALRNAVAPRSMGPVKTRLAHAQSVLGRRNWTPNRVRDLWYRDERASAPAWDEINDIEEITGLKYARQELREVNDLIAAADRLTMAGDTDFASAFVAAIRSVFGAGHRARASKRTPD